MNSGVEDPGAGRGAARPVRVVGLLLRVLILVAIFAGVGIWAAHLVIAREIAQGKPEYAVRLASYMTGLFAGGIVATVAGGLMLLLSRRSSAETNQH